MGRHLFFSTLRDKTAIFMKKHPTDVGYFSTVIEINDLDELKNLINSLPEGTVYSLNLEVVELGQET